MRSPYSSVWTVVKPEQLVPLGVLPTAKVKAVLHNSIAIWIKSDIVNTTIPQHKGNPDADLAARSGHLANRAGQSRVGVEGHTADCQK